MKKNTGARFNPASTDQTLTDHRQALEPINAFGRTNSSAGDNAMPLTEREQKILAAVREKESDFYAGLLAIHMARTGNPGTSAIVDHVVRLYKDVEEAG